MRAMVYTKPDTLELLDVDEPVTNEGEVIVEVEACGICGSELHGIAKPGFRQPPLIMGHEFSGRDPKGRAVAVNPIVSCGECDLCQSGRNEVCRNRSVVGIHRQGALRGTGSRPRAAALRAARIRGHRDRGAGGTTRQRAARLAPRRSRARSASGRAGRRDDRPCHAASRQALRCPGVDHRPLDRTARVRRASRRGCGWTCARRRARRRNRRCRRRGRRGAPRSSASAQLERRYGSV